MVDETDLIEFTSYRFPNKRFLFTKQQLKKYREIEQDVITKEAELREFVKNKEVENEGE